MADYPTIAGEHTLGSKGVRSGVVSLPPVDSKCTDVVDEGWVGFW